MRGALCAGRAAGQNRPTAEPHQRANNGTNGTERLYRHGRGHELYFDGAAPRRCGNGSDSVLYLSRGGVAFNVVAHRTRTRARRMDWRSTYRLRDGVDFDAVGL